MTHRIPLGPFELYRRVGRGGMGEVWEGLHVPQQIPVAVKILTHHGAKNSAYVDAFRNEVRAAATLNHYGIVTVLDFGEIPAGAARLSEGLFAPDSPYIIMEFARRGSLKRFVNGIGWRELKVSLFTVLDALAHAHACGVIHRDLKPANILVGCGPEHEAGIKLTDFGLAHAVDQHEFAGSTDSGWGTPQFMAPEQFRGAWRDYGPWTDLYAMGVMTYYLAAGRYPFEAEDTAGFARAHQLEAPEQFAPRFAVPEGLDEWINRLMQKDPRHRFQCAADAAFALQKLGDPVDSRERRGTVSMMPTHGARDKWLSDDRFRSVKETAQWRSEPLDDAATIVDRPNTTRLIEFDASEDSPLFRTHSFNVSDWADVTVGATSEPIQRAAYAEAPPMPHTWRRPKREPKSPKLVGAGLGLFGLRNLPMVDRHDERDYLWETLRTVHREREARAVVVRGPAGTGKTRMARWLTLRAHEVGAATIMKSMFSPIAGPGDGLSRMVAQQMRAGGMNVEQTTRRVEDVLANFGVRDPLEVDAMSRFVMPLGTLSTTSASMSIRVDGPNQRYGLLLRHLQRLTEDRPVIVWFDDVQWGADALAFAQFILERQHQTPVPVLFLCTARNEALVERRVETQLVSELALNRRARVLDIEPLGPADTGELVRELLYLSPDLAHQVEERCGGNPLFAVQLVGDWVAGQKLRFGARGFELKDGVDAEIPDDLHTIWRERLALLLRKRPIDDLKALEVAAALGTNVDLEEWYEATNDFGVSSPPDLTRELFESGLATPVAFGFEFCHGLFRESLERSAKENARWRDINASCVAMLEFRYQANEFPVAERLALHLMEAERFHAAIEPLLSAAKKRVERSEFDVALGLLDERDELLDIVAPGDSRERAVGRVVRAQVHLWQGRYELAERFASTAAVEARRSSWSDVLGRALLTEALAHLYRGALDKAERLFERAAVELTKVDDESGKGDCMHGLGRVAEARGKFDEAESHFEQARETMTREGNALGEAQALNALGDLARDQGQWDDAMQYAARASELFESLQNSIGVADCTNDLAELYRLRGEFDSARDHCLRALRMYEALGSEHAIHVRINLALTLTAVGQQPQARQLLDECRVRLERTDQEGQLAMVDMLLVPLLITLNESDLARRRFHEAAAVLERTGLRGRDLREALRQAAALSEQRGSAVLAASIREFVRDVLDG